MPSKVKIVSRVELDGMHTGTLMARRKALLACEESLEESDRDEGYHVEDGYIEFKQSKDWSAAYTDLKLVLGTREHWKAPR